MDAEKGKGIELARRYKVAAYPTFLLTTSQGVILDRWAGYEGVDAFTTTLREAVQDPTTVEEKIARYREQPTLGDARRLGRILSEGGDYARGIQYYREAARLDPDRDYAFKIFETTAIGCRHDAFPLDSVTRTAEAALASDTVDPVDKAEVYYYARWLAKKKQAGDYALQFLERAWRAVEEAGEAVDADVVTDLSIEHALYLEKDPARAAQLKYDSMPEGWRKDPDQINRYAWWCVQHEVDTRRAAELAHHGIEIAPPGPGRAALLDTAAELCRRLGRRQEALEHLRQAVKEDPSKVEYSTKLKEWEETGT